MTAPEKFLLYILSIVTDRDIKAVLLQSFIAEYGPLSEKAAKLVRENLKAKQ